MAQSSLNVAAASPLTTGGILTAPVGTALPTDASASLNAAFKALGYAADDGVQPSGDAPSTTDITAWGGDTVASLVESAGSVKYTFTLIESFNSDTAKLLYGASNVTVTAATSGAGTKLAIQDKGAQPAIQPYVFEMLYGIKRMRIVVPRGQLVISSERPFVSTDVMGWECELTCLSDSSGVRQYRYWANDDVTP